MGSPSYCTFKHKPERRSVPKDLKVSQIIEDCQLSEVTTGLGWGGELVRSDATGMPWESQPIWHWPGVRGAKWMIPQCVLFDDYLALCMYEETSTNMFWHFSPQIFDSWLQKKKNVTDILNAKLTSLVRKEWRLLELLLFFTICPPTQLQCFSNR